MSEFHEKARLSIKRWSEGDRPREKFLSKGKAALTDAELLAILIRTGTRDESALDISRKLLHRYQGDLRQLGQAGVSDLMRYRGIGRVKAITLAAALELGRRRQNGKPMVKVHIQSSADAYQLMMPLLSDLPHEEFWVVLLSRSNKVIGKERISVGGVSGTVVDPKIIFKKALEKLASSVILCHNHPSGSLRPSKADMSVTHKLRDAGKSLEINILDHLIIGNNSYFSFADDGLL